MLSENLSARIDKKFICNEEIFQWFQSLADISDEEMLKTFNCGVGFCLIAPKKNVKKIKNFFEKKFRPYEIGFVSKSSKRLNLKNKLEW